MFFYFGFLSCQATHICILEPQTGIDLADVQLFCDCLKPAVTHVVPVGSVPEGLAKLQHSPVSACLSLHLSDRYLFLPRSLDGAR